LREKTKKEKEKKPYQKIQIPVKQARGPKGHGTWKNKRGGQRERKW